ncbi:unnamed protein product [Closterium sp. NIES-53]
MASLRVLAFDHEGRPVAFDTWHDDLQLYLLSDIKDSVSLFDHVSGVALAPPATAHGVTRSQWLSRDATARLAICNHLPVAECTHFGLHRTSQALYDAVVACYSSPATAALGRLLLPYLFPELSAFATVADLVTHLRTSDARYRATVPAEFLAMNQPPMFITLYFIVSRLPDSLSSNRDHFLSLDPTSLTVDLLEQHLLAAETSAVAVGAANGTPRLPFFDRCSPSPLSPSFASAAAANVSVPEDVGAALTSAKCRSSKGKGGRGGGGGSGGGGGGSGSGGGGSGGGGGGSGGGGGGGTGGGSGGLAGGGGGNGGGSGGSGGSGGGGTGGGRSGPRRGGPGGGQRQQQQRRSETQSPQQLREWLVQRGTGGGSETCPYVICTGVRAGQTCGKFHTEHRCFSRLDDAWPAEFGDEAEHPRWTDLLRSGVAIFDLDYDAIISAMYALSFSAEGDSYRCVPPDPGIAAAALGASASGTPPGTVPAEALHTFTLDSGTSRYFFRDSSTLTPLPAPIPVRLADPSGGPVVARSSTVLPCPAVPSGSLSGLHLPSFSTNLVSTAALQDAMVTTTTLGGQRVSICTCTRTGRHLATSGSRLLLVSPPDAPDSSVGHPSLPRLCGMHSLFLVSGLPRSLPPLPPSPSPPCLPCVEGRQRAAPHSSSFPLTTAPLQTLHMDVWGPAHVSGQQMLGLVIAVHGAASPKEPATVQHALGGEHKEKWLEAMDRELKALEDRSTWKIVRVGVARNKTVLTGKWVFRVKTKADGTIDKFKARRVVRGFDQEHGQDFTETFAPISRHTSLRILLAIVAMKRKKLRQIDVTNAFLYAPVDAEIFVEQPHKPNADPNQVCQLQKSLYGIKQAPRLRQQNLHARLIRIGFCQLPHDQGMYRLTKGTDYILLIVYVDDLLYIGSTDSKTTWFEGELQRDLSLTVSSTVTQYLGLNIQDKENAIYLSAAKYADTIAKSFGLTPATITTPYRYTDGNRKEASALLQPAGICDYQRKLGCLLFTAITCRPDLSYSASQLATHLKKPEADHMAELDRALHYLVSTPKIGLTYHKTKTTTPKLIGHVDADHAGDQDIRRSRTSYIYRLEPIGPISWQSSKQELIALSSAEA